MFGEIHKVASIPACVFSKTLLRERVHGTANER